MSGRDLDNNRLLLEISNRIRELNRNIINPVIPELTLDDLNPVLSMVARARAAYLNKLFDVAAVAQDQIPSHEQVNQLNHLRTTYEELVTGVQALESAIERGYIDVQG
ncbi:MAG: hypothetical protein GY814_14945 [Gammaproteobacteria bacterium]|nr:hypothetical protein [Gammaproteobacteria bacterium]